MINWGHPITKNLIVALPFVEKGGTNVFDQAMDSNKVLNGSSTWIKDAMGYVINCAGGSNDYISVNSGVTIGNKANCSVMLWVNTTLATTSADRALYCERGSSGNDIWKIELISSTFSGFAIGSVDFVHRDDAGTLDNHVFDTSVTINDGKWHQVVATKQGVAVKLYIDGFLRGSGNLTGSDTFTDATLGSRICGDKGDATGACPAEIAHCLIWSRSLLPYEIRQLYTNQWQIYNKPGMLQSLNSLAVAAASNKVFKTLLGAGNI